jgi:hypothetical protein
MFGIRHLQVPPTTYVMHYRRGKLAHSGAGLSFFYLTFNSELVLIPLASTGIPFVFNEVTSDFQEVTIQGELTYRVVDPALLSAILDYSVDGRQRHRTDDPSKLNDRLVHATQILARSFTQKRLLRDVLVESDALLQEVLDGLKKAPAVSTLGVEVLGLSILGVKATPEMAKALQAQAREELLQTADEAVYARRNAAVEQERRIKESELNTEIAVELKRRTVRETQMAAEIAVEEQRATLVDRRVENERKEADARAHALEATLTPLKDVDWRTLMAASGGAADPKLMIALAFRELAENASKIGEVNISPELLNSLTKAGK